MAILNYTSKISSEQSISEIQKILVRKGASKITTDYTDGIPTNLTFVLSIHDNVAFYSLPCRIDGVYKSIGKIKNNTIRPWMKTRDQAANVAWRILKDWVEAQMALIDAELAELPEVFLPYTITRGGETLYQYIKDLPANTTPLQLN